MVGGYVLAPRSLVEFIETLKFTSDIGFTYDLPDSVCEDLIDVCSSNKLLLLNNIKFNIMGREAIVFAPSTIFNQPGFGMVCSSIAITGSSASQTDITYCQIVVLSRTVGNITVRVITL